MGTFTVAVADIVAAGSSGYKYARLRTPNTIGLSSVIVKVKRR